MADDQQTSEEAAPSDSSFVAGIVAEIFQSPLNIALVGIITFLVYKIVKSRHPNKTSNAVKEPELPKLRKDFTVQELKAFDGNQQDGRVLVAVNGSVYDVTRGKRFYGPGMVQFSNPLPYVRPLKILTLVCNLRRQTNDKAYISN